MAKGLVMQVQCLDENSKWTKRCLFINLEKPIPKNIGKLLKKLNDVYDTYTTIKEVYYVQ